MIDPLDVVTEHDELAELDPAARRLRLRSLVLDAGIDDAPEIIVRLADAIDGYGPLTSAMNDPLVSDVLVNGPDEVWIERAGILKRLDERFGSDEELSSFIERLFGTAGGRVDVASPIGDVCLDDGSRMHVVLPPIATNGPLVSIRRHPRVRPTVEDLVGSTLTAEQARVLNEGVLNRKTIVISGATGAGKTTLLNALLGCVPTSERIVIIEETRELIPACAHWVSLVARSPNPEGRGSIDLDQLLRASLRMRPDRIVVGEVRGVEAAIALKAMSVGHEGSMVTVHARSSAQALERLVELALEARGGAGAASIRRQVDRAVDLVVHLDRGASGRRVVDIRDAGS